jgi:hypothetical protein
LHTHPWRKGEKVSSLGTAVDPWSPSDADIKISEGSDVFDIILFPNMNSFGVTVMRAGKVLDPKYYKNQIVVCAWKSPRPISD